MKLLVLLALCVLVHAQRRVGRFSEVYSWKQLTYNINGNILTTDRATADGLERERFKRQRPRYYDAVYFNNQPNPDRDSNIYFPSSNLEESTTRAPNTLDERSDNFYIKYNNVPMGAERVGNRLFVSVPRRRYGIPSTLNYIDLSDTARSPHLRPYPSLRASRSLTSVYRTRADSCGRLWAVDTGLLELPDNPQQIQQPAIVVFDLQTDRQILRYELKNSDVPANNTPTGLASITVDSNSCSDTYAYIPDLTTFGLVVFSLRARDSWRLTHNYFHFNPAHASLNIAGQRFQWSDGIFSIVLAPGSGCRAAYFHPLISTQEFAVNTCTLNNRTAASDPDYWARYAIVGDRGPNSQSTMHDIHRSGVVLFATIGADGVACWRSGTPLRPSNVPLLASDARALSYPADLHITGDEVWVIANTLPRFGYSRLNPEDYNFFIYKANIQELIAGTVCDSPRRNFNTDRDSDRDSNRDSNRDYDRDSNRDYDRDSTRQYDRDSNINFDRDSNRESNRNYDRDSNRDYDRIFDIINQNSDPIRFGTRSNIPPAPSTSGFQSSAYNKYN